MNRATLATNIRQSISRFPPDHYAHPRARRQLELLESDCPLTPSTMTKLRQNVDWYVDYLERKTKENYHENRT